MEEKTDIEMKFLIQALLAGHLSWPPLTDTGRDQKDADWLHPHYNVLLFFSTNPFLYSMLIR